MPTAQPHRVTVIPGDGVGPEVVRSAVRIIAAEGVPVDWEEAEAGAEVFKRGDTSGVPQATRDSIERTKVVLKGPLETPVGFGEKSANVTLRKLFETYANVRPARELPGVPTRYAGEGVDMIVVRENVEDLYAGIEHMLTPDVGSVPQDHQPEGFGEGHPLRLRAGPPRGSAEGHLRDQGQHHEVDRGPVQMRSSRSSAPSIRRSPRST